MRVLLTGPFGNIGSHTTAELLRQGHQVRVFDLCAPRTEKVAQRFADQIEVRWSDIRNEALRRAAAPDRAAEHPQIVAVLASPANPVNHHRRVRSELGGFVSDSGRWRVRSKANHLVEDILRCQAGRSIDSEKNGFIIKSSRLNG